MNGTNETIKMRRPLSNVLPPSAERPNVSLFIAVPAYGGMVTTRTMMGLLKLTATFSQMQVEHAVFPVVNESLVTRARNRCVSEFLGESRFTHLLFVDADVGFVPRDVQALFAGDADIVAAAYPMKGYEWPVIAAAAQDGVEPDKLATWGCKYPSNVSEYANHAALPLVRKGEFRFIEVRDAPTGFMLIKRAALERFVAHYREEIAYTTDYHPFGKTAYAVFDAGIDPEPEEGRPRRYLSEDYLFCRRWQRMGGAPILLALEPKLTHTGTHTWVGDLSCLFEESNRGRADEAGGAGSAPGARVGDGAGGEGPSDVAAAADAV